MQTLNTFLDSTLAMYAGLALVPVLIGSIKLAGNLFIAWERWLVK